MVSKDRVIEKFIEKCGPLDPKPQYAYAQGSKFISIGSRIVQGPRFGITSNPSVMFEKMQTKFQKDWNRFPQNLMVSTAYEVLPSVVLEIEGQMYEWDETNLLDAMMMFQNRPFDKLLITRFKDEPIPMLFSRKDVDVSVLLAPRVRPIPITSDLAKERKKKIRGSVWSGKGILPEEWKKQILNTTFWIVEWPTESPDSVEGHTYGYPIGKMVKCRKCGFEIGVNDWSIKYLRDNHPDCTCSCETYEDFCGCRRMREMWSYDRLRRQQSYKNRMFRNHWDLA